MTELDKKSPANSMYPVPTREMDNPPDMGAPVRGWLLYYWHQQNNPRSSSVSLYLSRPTSL
jgi:hypothetical protein